MGKYKEEKDGNLNEVSLKSVTLIWLVEYSPNISPFTIFKNKDIVLLIPSQRKTP